MTFSTRDFLNASSPWTPAPTLTSLATFDDPLIRLAAVANENIPFNTLRGIMDTEKDANVLAVAEARLAEADRVAGMLRASIAAARKANRFRRAANFDNSEITSGFRGGDVDTACLEAALIVTGRIVKTSDEAIAALTAEAISKG